MNSFEQGFALEGLRVEPLTGLVSGPGGREKLDPKVMDVLVLMAVHAGQVVPREDLLGRLWPNVVVTDDALTRCFYELRRQLSRAGGDEKYRSLIETLPKRGYRLNAIVKPFEAPGEPKLPVARPRRERALPTAIGSALALLAIGVALYVWRSPDLAEAPAAAPEPHSIAVLPFLDLSAGHDHGYFSDGVTEEILNKLSQADNLRVISRTSSFALRDETLDVPRIAARLNVSYVLEGSVRRSGERVRITAQLIDASTNSHIWSQTYDRALGDLFTVQDEIAASVAAALQVSLAGKKPGERIPRNIEAYEQFLQGQFFYNRRSPGDIERAVERYQQAIARDPAYARAWAALAGAYAILAAENDPAGNRFRELQRKAAEEAVSLDPGLAVAQARLAQFYWHQRQPEKAAEHMRAAVALDPDDPLVLGFTAADAIRDGDTGRAVELWRRVVAQDPLSPTSRGNFGVVLLAHGQPENALTQFRRALELNPDSGSNLEVDIARSLILLERYGEAEAAIARLPDGPTRDYAVALLHRAPGRFDEAEAALRRLASARMDVLDHVHLAEAYAFRGRRDVALDSLMQSRIAFEKNRAQRPRDPWNFQEEIRVSPFLKPLHGDPRWAEITAYPG